MAFFPSVLLMFLFGPCSFRGFSFLRLFVMKMGLLFFLVFGGLWLFFLLICLYFYLGPALLEGFLFETLCHENGSSLSSGVWLSFDC